MNRNAKSIEALSRLGSKPFPFNAMHRFTLPENPDDRVAITAAAMCALVHHAVATSEDVHALAMELKERRDKIESLWELWRFLKRTQRRIDDPSGVEFLRHPGLTAWQARYAKGFDGDCDCLAMLGAAIAGRMGFDAIAFIVTAREGRAWEHVYFRVLVSGEWYAMDPQENPKPFDEREYAARLLFPSGVHEMPFPTFNVYHCIAAKLQAGGVPLVYPKFPPSWQRAFTIYESPWTNNSGGDYNVDLLKFGKYLDGMQNPSTDPVYLWETHSAGSCDVNFDGPIVLDMERFAFTQKPAAFADVMRRCQAWRPKAQWMFYGSVSRWASQWDSDPATYMALNDAYNAAVYSFHKHVPLYLQTADTAAQWEKWNDKNVMELVRQCAVTGGKPYVMVRPQQSPDGGATWPVITTIAQALAQVRPAIRHGCDIQVWDYWYNNADRDAAAPGLALIDQAISQARAELWSV